MLLATVMSQAETELICDFAEVYRVYDYQALPARMAAALVSGLGENSRIMKKLSGEKYSREIYLLAAIADRLSYLVWFKTKDAEKNRNRPRSFVEALRGEDKSQSGTPEAFATKEELDAALARFERK